MKTLQWQGSLGAKQGFSLIPLLLRNETPSWGFLRLMYLVLSVSSSVCLSETKNRVNDTNDVLFFFFFRMGEKIIAYEIVNFPFLSVSQF